MVVAMLALAVAIGGTATAGLIRQKGDKIIKKNSLSGNRLKNHTITGNQVNLSKLGKVPNALNADTAGLARTATNANNAINANNANALGGAGPSAYAGSAQPAYIVPTLNAGFTNVGIGFAPAGYGKDTLGYVHLRGAVACSGPGIVFTLPEGYRPGTNQFMVEADGLNGASALQVFSSGNVTVRCNSATSIGLDGAVFPAAGTAGN